MILFDNSYFVLGKDFKISKDLTILNPTVEAVLDMGEDKYQNLLNRFISKPWDQKIGLFEIGIDFEELDDIEFFKTMLSGITIKESQLLFGDFDFSKLRLQFDNQAKEYVLGYVDYTINMNDSNSPNFKTLNRDEAIKYIKENEEKVKDCIANEIIIDKLSYNLLSDFLRKMHHVPISEKPKYGSKHAKEYMIRMEKDKLKYSNKNNKSNESQLINMMSYLANMDNGYTYENIPQMKISTFYDAVMRTNRIMHHKEFMTGFYAGTEAIMRYGGKSLMENQDSDELNCLGHMESLSSFEKMRKQRSINGNGEDNNTENEYKHSFGTKKYK